MTSVILPEECALSTYFTVTIKNLILLHVKSDWDPPVQPSVALETFLEVKFDLANMKLNRPKDNLEN